MANVTTSHFEIFDYWKDKIIERNGNVTTDISSPGVDVIVDWGEPCCWACGKPIIGHYEKHLADGEDIDFKKLWNDKYVKSQLNRCHIIPGSLGGKDEPKNLFLLCANCHEESPDTVNARSFYRWVYKMRREKMCCGELSPHYLLDKVSEELNRRGLPNLQELVGEINSMGYKINTEGVWDYIYKHMGTHGVHSVESSRICGVTDWFVHNYLNACLESAEQHGIID